jgi:histidinol-phosphate aminotransferase
MKLAKFKKLKIQSYKPGKYEIPSLKKTRKIIKLSANESALGVSSKVKAILRKNISISKYPDYTSK